MAEDRASIDGISVLDNLDQRQVEYDAEIGGEIYPFAARYGVLEALGAVLPETEADVVGIFNRHRDAIEVASARALARGPGIGRVIVGEGDLD